MSDYVIVIPARLKSSRLPDKPLLDIAGKTLLERTYETATRSAASRIVIATDSEAILDVAKSAGAEAYLSETVHECGTDRMAECVRMADIPNGTICVNLQVDEPEMPAMCLDQVADNLNGAVCQTLAVRSSDLDHYMDPNVVKVVTGEKDLALYFSRAPIPYHRDRGHNSIQDQLSPVEFLRHVGLYAYESEFLQEFSRLPASPAETLERLEQLRMLHYGYPIKVAIANAAIPAGVDTAEDLQRVRRNFESKTL